MYWYLVALGAVAAARFIATFAETADAGRHFFEEPGSALITALRRHPGCLADPDHAQLAQDAVAILIKEGHPDCQDLPSNSTAAIQAPLTTAATRTTPLINVPLVCELPSLPGQEIPEQIGIMAKLSVSVHADDRSAESVTRSGWRPA